MRMLKKVDTRWSPTLAYVVGIIATDGNLSPDGRHIAITSKDEELLTKIRKNLALTSKIGKKTRGNSLEKKYFVLQIGDKNFYNFLLSINLTPKKSKTIGELLISREHFPHFFRGCMDGDGSITISNHPESSKKQLRIRLCSASKKFVLWIMGELASSIHISGGWIYSERGGSLYTLSYGKADSIKIIHFMYDEKGELYLGRKFNIAKKFMGK